MGILRGIILVNIDISEIIESGFISKVDFDLLVPIEVMIFLRKRFLAVEIILLQITLIYHFFLFTILK